MKKCISKHLTTKRLQAPNDSHKKTQNRHKISDKVFKLDNNKMGKKKKEKVK